VLLSVDHIDDGLSGDFGRSLLAVPDRNGDGVADFAVGATQRNADQEARVEVLSGVDGAQLLRIDGPGGTQGGFGDELALLDDIDGDDYPELIISSPRGYENGNLGKVEVRSGLSGTLLYTFTGLPLTDFGDGVAGATDLSGDGVADIVIGTPFALEVADILISFPMVQVFSGADGSLVWEREQTSEVFSQYGEVVRMLDDLDGDGIDDIAVGSPGFVTTGRFIELLSGADGTTIGTLDAQPNWNGFGQIMAVLDDLDGDGVRELGLGLPAEGQVAEGAVRVLSPVTGNVLHTFTGEHEFGFFGSSVTRAGDLDLDGLDDILVGEPMWNGSGKIHAFSGLTGTLIFELDSPTDQSICCGFGVEFGASLANLGDLNGDGLAETAVGAPGAEAVYVLSYRPAVGMSYCTSLPTSTGNASEISAFGTERIGRDALNLQANNVPTGQFGLFYYGQNTASVPIGNGIRCVGAGPAGLARLSVHAADGAGLLTHRLDYDAAPNAALMITAGSTWRFQAWFRDTPAGGAGFNFSTGIEFTFEP